MYGYYNIAQVNIVKTGMFYTKSYTLMEREVMLTKINFHRLRGTVYFENSKNALAMHLGNLQ